MIVKMEVVAKIYPERPTTTARSVNTTNLLCEDLIVLLISSARKIIEIGTIRYVTCTVFQCKTLSDRRRKFPSNSKVNGTFLARGSIQYWNHESKPQSDIMYLLRWLCF
jgi:hypothetical protein